MKKYKEKEKPCCQVFPPTVGRRGGEQTLLHRLVSKCEEVILIIHNKRAEVSFFGSRIADSFPVYMPLF